MIISFFPFGKEKEKQFSGLVINLQWLVDSHLHYILYIQPRPNSLKVK